MTGNLNLRTERRQLDVGLGAVHSEAHALKHVPAETPAELDALLPAILDRTFKGKL